MSTKYSEEFKEEALAFFDWTPTTAGTFDLELVVNPGNVIEEKDYTNNTLSSTLTVLPAYVGTDPLAADPTLELHYPGLPAGNNNNYVTWTENGVTYWARLNFSAGFSEPDIDPMRSGYGISVKATASVTHNYYNTERIGDPVGVIMLLPEYDYKEGGFVKKTRHPNFVNSYFGHCMTPSVWVAQRKDDMVSRSSGTLDTLAAFRYYQPTTGACNDPGGRPRGRRAPFPSWLSYHAACDSA